MSLGRSDQPILVVGSSFLVGLALFGSLRQLRLHQLGGNDWITGDWLINYDAGFVRRGLSGSLILTLSDLVDTTPTLVVGVVLAVLWTTTCLAVLVLWRRSQADFARLFILLSPGFLAFEIWDFQGGARKELAIFCFLAVMLASRPRDHKARVAPVIWTTFFTVLPPILILTHELVAFTVPLLVVAFYLHSRDFPVRSAHKLFFYVGISVFSALALAVAILNPGTPVQRENICISLQMRGSSDIVCAGAVSWIGKTSDDVFAFIGDYADSHFLVVMYLLTAGMATLPFLYFRSARSQNGFSTLGVMALASMAVLPLFAVGADWGRWIHIVATLSTVLVLAFPSQFAPVGFSLSAKRGILTPSQILVLTLYSMGWSIDHFGGNDVAPGLLRLLDSFNLERFFT